MKKKILSFLLAGVISAGVFTMAFTNKVSAEISSDRLEGPTRIETAIKVSQDGFSGSNYAILAYAWNYPDALSAAPLAKKYNAPILLTDKDALNENVKAELKRLNVKTVFIVGGTGVVSDKVASAVQSLGMSVKRLAGLSRYATAVEIAKEVGTTGEIAVTYGEDFADALSIAPLAAKKGMPLILVNKTDIDSSVKNYLTKNNISKAYVVGGSDVISDAVVSSVPNAERILGNDKYERNINVINKFKNVFYLDNVYIATGEVFADALAGAALAPMTSSPIVLVNKVPSLVTKNFMNSNASQIARLRVLGGEGPIPNATLDAVKPKTQPTDDDELIVESIE